ncbi:MAG: Glycerol-3-phosphate dehydrogenase [NAD(P)+] [Chlamydiae bacterium]|nr:Glycerol-3-phosphate dehydrogenase [NAD(P)+] [Chlamydiota bacterium]
MKRVGYLGSGAWGVCLADLLAKKGHHVKVWCRNADLAKTLNETRQHPNLKDYRIHKSLHFTPDLAEVLEDIDFLIESVTSSGVRKVFEQVKDLVPSLNCPIVMTSKGIEQDSGFLLLDVALDVLGKDYSNRLTYLSGPSFADEVIRELPTTIVCAGFDPEVTHQVQELFHYKTFRIYPNYDIKGVEFGGAMKNIIAIACGTSDGLGFGNNSRAALMTRGLHEIRKLAIAKECRAETINGLSGMGDLCLTCSSKYSRNYRFGNLIALGKTMEEAKKEIGMVVEGAYTCVSALQIAKKMNVSLPITEAVYHVLYKNLKPMDAVKSLLTRAVKEEHL